MKKFLVAYDYGMGAQWAFVVASSEDALRKRFPDLIVFSALPACWGSAGFEDSVREFTLDRLGADWLGRTDSTEGE